MSTNNVFIGKKTLTKKQATKAKIGSVFIVNDKEIFNKKGPNKIRRVVLIGKRNGSLLIAPVRRHPPISMELSNFDGERSLILSKAVLISKNKVYSRFKFKGTQNDYLTTKEKILLKKKW